MTLEEFRATLDDDAPPVGLGGALTALWLDARGDWDGAHDAANDTPDPDGAWVHAYLHRKEGDLSNARYWYRRAHRDEATGAFEDEWTRIVGALVARSGGA